MEGYGRRVQYSVFECEVQPDDLRQMQERLRGVINEAQDDIRVYRLCSDCLSKVITLGKAELNRQQSYVVV